MSGPARGWGVATGGGVGGGGGGAGNGPRVHNVALACGRTSRVLVHGRRGQVQCLGPLSPAGK